MTSKFTDAEPPFAPEVTPMARPSAASAPRPEAAPSGRGDFDGQTAIPRRKRWLWAVLLILATGGGLYVAWRLGAPIPGFSRPVAEAKKPPPKVTPVTTVAAKRQDFEIYLNALGTVTAYQTVTVRARVEGELTKVAFTEGQTVKAGDLLAEIDARPYEAQRDQAEGQLARDVAGEKGARLTLDRYRELLATKTVTAQQIDEQVAIVQQLEGAIRADRAMIANASLLVSFCRVTAPIDGKIGLRLVDAGNMLRANDPNGIAVITQLRPIALIFTIPQDEIGLVQARLNEGGELPVLAYDRGFERRLAAGKLRAIDNQVDSTTGTVRLKAVFENDDGALFPNQFVNVRLLVDTRKDAVAIPSATVQRGPEFSFAYVAGANDEAELRRLEIGPSEADSTLVEKGLAVGERVVVDGIDKLRPGAKIAVRELTPAAGDPSATGATTPAAASAPAAAPTSVPAADAGKSSGATSP